LRIANCCGHFLVDRAGTHEYRRRAMRHIIWDWNGTLFDDHHLVVASVNASLADLGVPPIDSAAYRRSFIRPLHAFYERLLGSPVDDALMSRIDDVFQAAYLVGLPDVGLDADAAPAISVVAEAGGTQSIASMLWHEMLVSTVTRFGHRGSVGETKAAHLVGHVERLMAMFPGVDRSRMVAIGDITDDAAAARAAGVGCVLYDGGSQNRDALEAEAFPVAGSLVEAVDIALAGRSG
jgi:phosphoglycolate phosphatase-like HAD superfamily hydrolase